MAFASENDAARFATEDEAMDAARLAVQSGAGLLLKFGVTRHSATDWAVIVRRKRDNVELGFLPERPSPNSPEPSDDE